MTSPSPTRPRTTRPPSIREPAAARALLAALALLAAAPAAVAGWRDLQRSEPPPSVVDSGAGEVAEPAVLETPAAGPVAGSPSDVLPVAAESAAEAPDDSESETGSSDPCDNTDPRSTAVVNMDRRKLDIRLDKDNEPLVDGRNCPSECHLRGDVFEPRRFATTMFTWKAAGYCHKPLYFEHWNLERYGHSHGFAADTFLSAVHFFARIPALPYQMGVELPWECVYPLGYYRPGSCAPWTVPAVPVSARGLALEAAAATGIVFILP